MLQKRPCGRRSKCHRVFNPVKPVVGLTPDFWLPLHPETLPRLNDGGSNLAVSTRTVVPLCGIGLRFGAVEKKGLLAALMSLTLGFWAVAA
jgi:hypothetical protein